jgi:hypothetical protein
MFLGVVPAGAWSGEYYPLAMTDPIDLEGARQTGLALAFAKHIAVWLAGVEGQDRRVREGFAQMARERWADPHLYAVALRDLIRACLACRKLSDREIANEVVRAVDAFETAAPHAREIRNRLEHFDEYEQESGLSVFITNDEMGDLALHVDDLVLNLTDATREAGQLARACLLALQPVLGL